MILSIVRKWFAGQLNRRCEKNLNDAKEHHSGFFGSILFDVGELHQHLFCIKKYRKDTLKSFRINLATNS
ncbi:hypothetical protein FIU53_12355 [Enterococcus faecium]|nr:hypothetical protein FIU53_12355 [Enterococcus faecium]TNX55124.1 hypothetical protein FIU30_12410 [Enterococcus faecium]